MINDDGDLLMIEDPKSANPDLENHNASLKISQHRESVRTRIATTVIYSYLVIGALMAILGVFMSASANVEKVAIVVFSPLTGIVGSVVGFYFSTAQAE